ncbi:squalene/phytoene synthase family protein [uncultured Ramlibacter sp.]|uniref:phytoene/squalene synthase family protein n=1 Tax=uncultured Ramlibacter sp. TaxID=260755 RepID=UPI00262868A1|nr:squalene/phytoene synthase family protein [uncultured Ramlibacter sp.]
MTPPSPPPAAPDQLLLLRGVSRSFYLSIRLLPPPLREPIAVAYLLARATDTVADTTGLPAPQRLVQLQVLGLAIEGYSKAREAIPALAASFSALQQDPAETALIQALPQCLAWLDALGPADRADVREVLRKITHGQMLDVERFGDGGALQALADAQELHGYTYLVAGCVGEFWTTLCQRHLAGFATLQAQRMLELARDYGMGLQLVNILRDLPADLAAGRCYLPRDELAAAGLTPQDLLRESALAAPLQARWRGEAARKLVAGMDYALAVNSRRVRAASALPALLGARTLALLAQPQALGQRVKVPRSEVRAMALRLALGLAGRSTLTAMSRALRAAARDADGTIGP